MKRSQRFVGTARQRWLQMAYNCATLYVMTCTVYDLATYMHTELDFTTSGGKHLALCGICRQLQHQWHLLVHVWQHGERSSSPPTTRGRMRSYCLSCWHHRGKLGGCILVRFSSIRLACIFVRGALLYLYCAVKSAVVVPLLFLKILQNGRMWCPKSP